MDSLLSAGGGDCPSGRAAKGGYFTHLPGVGKDRKNSELPGVARRAGIQVDFAKFMKLQGIPGPALNFAGSGHI
jgi:hypothetical protein